MRFPSGRYMFDVKHRAAAWDDRRKKLNYLIITDSRRAPSRWGYDWSEDEARKTILRTHTTAVSARTLYEMGQESAGVFR